MTSRTASRHSLKLKQVKTLTSRCQESRFWYETTRNLNQEAKVLHHFNLKSFKTDHRWAPTLDLLFQCVESYHLQQNGGYAPSDTPSRGYHKAA